VKRLSSFRFFAAVAPAPAPLAVVLAILAATAAGLEAVSTGSSDWVLASILLVQLFACSSGFTRHASRGYCDPVLVGGSRPTIAVAHFSVAALPGALAWIMAGLAGAVAARSLSTPAFRPAGWIALLLVSAIPWALNLRFAPFVAGSLWLLVTAALLLSGRLFRTLGALHADPRWARSHGLEAIGLGLAFPAAVPSIAWPTPVLASLAALSAIALVAGIVTLSSASFPLSEEGS
jgi:hypothetical protein